MDNNVFGERLRALRERKELTQKELGDILGGLAESTLSSYESGKRQPSFNTLKKIANYFHCSTDYLLGETEILYPPPEMSDLNVEFIEVLAEWQKAGHTPEEIKEIWEHVSQIAKKYRK